MSDALHGMRTQFASVLIILDGIATKGKHRPLICMHACVPSVQENAPDQTAPTIFLAMLIYIICCEMWRFDLMIILIQITDNCFLLNTKKRRPMFMNTF